MFCIAQLSYEVNLESGYVKGNENASQGYFFHFHVITIVYCLGSCKFLCRFACSR